MVSGRLKVGMGREIIVINRLYVTLNSAWKSSPWRCSFRLQAQLLPAEAFWLDGTTLYRSVLRGRTSITEMLRMWNEIRYLYRRLLHILFWSLQLRNIFVLTRLSLQNTVCIDVKKTSIHGVFTYKLHRQFRSQTNVHTNEVCRENNKSVENGSTCLFQRTKSRQTPLEGWTAYPKEVLHFSHETSLTSSGWPSAI